MKQMSNKKFLILIAPVVLFIVVMWLTSCHSTRKQLNKAANTFDAHIKERDKFCNERYKPIEKTTTQIKYKPGKTVVKREHDTQFVSVDCPPSTKATTKTVKVYVPVQVDTLAIETMVERESVAALAVKDSTIADLRQYSAKVDTMYFQTVSELKKVEKKATKYFWYQFIPWGIIALAAAWKVRKWYLNGFKIWA